MDLLRSGQKITLFFQKGSNMVEMVSTIDNVYDDRLDLILPQYFMRYIEYLQEGQTLTAKVFSKIGTVDFNTIVLSSPLEETFTIELDYNAVRLASGGDIPVVNAMEKLQITRNSETLELKTFEISSEYIKFYSSIKFEINEFIDCNLILPKDYGIIKFRAMITDIDQIYDNEYTAQYSTMTEEARQNILYYMYLYSTNSD
jgi:hypothetical protein